MVLPVIFGPLTNPTLPELDQNFAALGALTVISCTVSGTNALILTPTANSPSIPAYAAFMLFSGVATATNTGPVTANVGGTGNLNVFRDSVAGPVQLTGGEIVIGNYFTLAYDPALNSGAGGFHLMSFGPSATLLVAATSVATIITSATGITYTAAQLTTPNVGQGIIIRGGAPSGGITDTTATAALIVGSIPGAQVNTMFKFRIVNTSGQTVTLGAGSGVTITGTATTATGSSHDFIAVITNIVTPAITIYG